MNSNCDGFTRTAHGTLDTPVNLCLIDEKRRAALKKISVTLLEIILNDRQICDFELIATGVYPSPIRVYEAD
jgi:sulfate adenylyltransferase